MSVTGNISPGASRLKRRLHATEVKTHSKYIRFLDAHPEEYQRFTDFLTISVGSSFRSPYAVPQVARPVLPEPVSYKREQGERRPRVRSAACARGEEPYSIAILLASFRGDPDEQPVW